MGLKTLIISIVLILLMLPGGIILWGYFGGKNPPNDHPASATVDFQEIQIDGHGGLIFKSTYTLQSEDGYYIFNLERKAKDSFTGRVMVSQKIQENSPITRDVLSAKGMFGDPDKIQWSVDHHHFTSYFLSKLGWFDILQLRLSSMIYHLIPYRPYHLIPGNSNIAGIIDTIEEGDKLKIKGFDVSTFNVDANNPNSRTFFRDKGCRTIIVTEIKIS